MTIQTFIEKAIEGGWKNAGLEEHTHPEHHEFCYAMIDRCKMLLDPLAWQAVGKVEGWKDCVMNTGVEVESVARMIATAPNQSKVMESLESALRLPRIEGWLSRMHRLIDALAEGKTIEQYLEML